jgi:hypothetical protein
MKKLTPSIIAFTTLTFSIPAFGAGGERQIDAQTNGNQNRTISSASSNEQQKRDPFPHHREGRLESRAGRN